MTAKEARKLTQRAEDLAAMPYVYKEIREAAKTGRSKIFLGRLVTDPNDIAYLEFKGYTVKEVSDENFDGWCVSW